jgi:carbon starvation protein CstA
MITFICSIVLLIGGYFIYGTFVEKQFGADGNRRLQPMKVKMGLITYP